MDGCVKLGPVKAALDEWELIGSAFSDRECRSHLPRFSSSHVAVHK